MIRKLLIFTSILEIAVSLALILTPSIVVNLLYGIEVTEIIIALGRFAGIALLGLGLACWPEKGAVRKNFNSAVRGMFTFNIIAAIYFFYVKIATGFDGILLLPAAVLHTVLAICFTYALLRDGMNSKNSV